MKERKEDYTEKTTVADLQKVKDPPNSEDTKISVSRK